MSVSLANRVAFGDQLRAQRGVVLDDAVVDDGDFARTVEMRVRVFIGGPAVRRPARVADADVAVQRFAVGQPLGQAGELALGLRADQVARHRR